MALMRQQDTWNPLRDLEQLTSRFNRFWGAPLAPIEREMLATTDWSPSCDIVETDAAYKVHAEIPNVKKEDVHVTLDNGVLTIQGSRKETKEEKGVKFHRRELSYGNFMRQFTMPANADPDKVDASFKDGILEINIPKTNGKAKEVRVH